MIKKIDKLVASSFVAPYVMSFFVAEFVLVLQFMWKYIDDILGKGFPISVLFELIFYFAIQIIPQAIPLTILISSIMVFGNLSERYELSSMKSAGISLIRIMAAAVLIAFCTSIFSFIASNYLKPKANFMFYSLFYTIRKQKPTLTIAESIFNKDFSNFVIRVGKKDPNGRDISDITIYDHSDRDKDKMNVITAATGVMYTDDQDRFVMELYDGNQLKDMPSTNRNRSNNTSPLMRTKFKVFTKTFDLGEFEVDEDSWGTSRNKHDMLNQAQLNAAIDTLEVQKRDKISELKYDFSKMFSDLSTPEDDIIEPPDIEEGMVESSDDLTLLAPRNGAGNGNKPAIQKSPRLEISKNKNILEQEARLKKQRKANQHTLKLLTVPPNQVSTFAELIDSSQRKLILEQASRESNSYKNQFINNRSSIISLDRKLRVYTLRKHQQYSWAVVCLIFVFIGAPLGSIIRKGGYGYPLLVAIIFYVSFIISIIMGEKLIRKNDFSAITAAWIPVYFLTPFAITFTLLALKDVKINFISYVRQLFTRKKEM